MKLVKAHIYGFGKWLDYQIDFSEKPFIVIFGENESGKSTLQQFLLFMLFGLAPKKREFHRPKTGGRIGGRLTLWKKGTGFFTIERIHEKNNGSASCYTEDGYIQNEIWLKEQLHGMTYDTYQSIFSFNANELQILHTINGAALGEVLLGIGLTGTDKIRLIEKKLDSELEQKFKPQGKKPELNKQLNYLDELNIEVKELQEEEASYREKKALKEQHERKIEEIYQKLDELQTRKEIIGKKIQVGPLVRELQTCKSKLVALGTVAGFPENGVERYQALKEQVFPLESERFVLRGNNETYKNKKKMFEAELLPLETIKQAELLASETDGYNRTIQQIEEIKVQKADLDRDIERDLEKLQIGLTVKDLKDMVLPFHVEDHWNSLKQELDRENIEKEQLINEEKTAREHLEAMEEQKREWEGHLLDNGDYEASKETWRVQNQRKPVQGQDSYQDNWKAVLSKKKVAAKNILWGCTAISVVLLAAALLFQTAWLFFAGGIFFAFVGFQFWFSQKSIKELEMLNYSVPIGQDQFGVTELNKLENRLEEHEHAQVELKNVKTQIDYLNRDQLKRRERLSLQNQKEERLDRSISEQIHMYPFLSQIEINFWPKLFRHLRDCLDKYQRSENMAAEIGDLEDQANHFETRLIRFLNQTNREIEDTPISVWIETIRDLIETHNKTKHMLDQYKQWVKQNQESTDQLLLRMKPYQEEMESLLSFANAEDEESYFKKGKLQAAKEELEDKQAELYGRINAVLSKRDMEEMLDKNNDTVELEVQLEKCKEDTDRLQETLKTMQQELANTKSIVEKMESSESYSIMSHRLELEKSRFQQQVHEWAVHQTAKEILRKTKNIYQNKYLPKVIERTSHYLQLLTEGKYQKVIPPSEASAFYVENRQGFRYDVSELSQGTTDQLYVSLRIALSEIMSREHTLPFMIDDAFVHFDEGRMKVMLNILEKMAETQQILLFTCRNDIKRAVTGENNTTHNLSHC